LKNLIIKYLKNSKKTLVSRVSGECELLALINCNDRQEAVNILSEINRIPGVEKAESHIILETIILYGKVL